MLDFCKKTQKNIYIYGYGRKGKLMYQYLTHNGIDIKGFVISDSQKKDDKIPVPIFHLSEIDGASSALLMGVSYHWYNVIFPEIVRKGISDIYFLTETKNYSELQKYDTWFFEKHENEEEVYLDANYSYNMARIIFSYLKEKGIELKRTIDFGGGIGAWSKAMKDEYGAEVIMLDGSPVDRSRYLEKDEFVSCDFTKDNLNEVVKKYKKFDLAMSIEVAEHLEERYLENFIDSMCMASDLILFSAATKYQGGNHHVNEQLQSYWVAKFAVHGYRKIDCIRKHFWDNTEVDCVVRQNCFVFANEKTYDDVIKKLGDDDLPIDIVHPEIFICKMYSHEEGWLL